MGKTFDISKWRKKAISMYGKARGLTKTQRDNVTNAIKGKRSSSTRKPRKPASSKKRRAKKTGKKKGGGRKGGRILGNVGWKGMLAGIAGLTVAKFLARKFLPVSEKYIDGAAMVAVGGVGKVAKIGTANLLPAGVMMLGSSLLEDVIFGGGIGFLQGAQASQYDV